MRTTFATAVEKMLLSRRRLLLDKKFEGTITPEEQSHLELVRSGLDDIEMARMAPELDHLEREVAAVEQG